jgi:uncharacterized protein (DUF1800 family)
MELLQKNKLLFSRAGFGISLADFSQPREIEASVAGLFPQNRPEMLRVVTEKEWSDNNPKKMRDIANEQEKKEKKKAFRDRTKDLNTLWIQAMATTSYPLLEKAALFWHGHFATHVDNPYYDQVLLDIFRKNALGNFGVLLREVSKSAAMLQFLNNQQNKKMHPNENFAREVMELFTLGRGHYTETDVKEAARAFTGWAHDSDGNFVFRQKQHDDGQKTFLGKTGNFNGDDILNIILEQKQTSLFITSKIYRFFVSDEKTDEKIVQQLAKSFYSSNYDIAALLKEMFTSDWFYRKNNYYAKVKSPVELLVGYQRLLPMNFQNDNTLIRIQRILGQYLFNPPSVAGWTGGRNWIDSSSLVVRMRLPEALFGAGELYLNTKDMPAEMHGGNTQGSDMHSDEVFKIGKTATDWTAYLEHWKKAGKDVMPAQIADFLLTGSLPDAQLQDAISFATRDTDEDFIKTLTIRIMELPEYQLS